MKRIIWNNSKPQTDSQAKNFAQHIINSNNNRTITCSNYLAILSIRVAVKQGKIDNKEIEILIENKTITFDKKGELSEYPPEFDCYNELLFELL